MSKKVLKPSVLTKLDVKSNVNFSITQNDIADMLWIDKIEELKTEIKNIKEINLRISSDIKKHVESLTYKSPLTKGFTLSKVSTCKHLPDFYLYVEGRYIYKDNKISFEFSHKNEDEEIKLEINTSDKKYTSVINSLSKEYFEHHDKLEVLKNELEIIEKSKTKYKSAMIKNILNSSEEGRNIIETMKTLGTKLLNG